MRILILLALAACSLAHAQSVWKLATGYREESFHTQNILTFSQDVASATKGALRIDVFPNSTLVKLPEIPQAVRSGRAEAGEVIMSALVGEIPIAGADSVPFVVNSYADARRLWQFQRPGIERHLRSRGLRLLYAVPWPPQGLHSVRPIRAVADLRGSRMRTYNATTVGIAQLVHAYPVDVPMVEVGKALSEGRIDNMITSAVTGVENRVWSSIRYYYEINAWFPKNVVFVNNQAFERLSPANQALVLRLAADAETRGWAACEAVGKSALEEMRSNGVAVKRPSHELEQDIKRLGERFSREWVRSVGNEANEIFVPYYTTPP